MKSYEILLLLSFFVVRKKTKVHTKQLINRLYKLDSFVKIRPTDDKTSQLKTQNEK